MHDSTCIYRPQKKTRYTFSISSVKLIYFILYGFPQLSVNTTVCKWLATTEVRTYYLVKQEAQLMLTNPRDASRGQSRSPSMVPFDTLGMVSYVPKRRRFSNIRLQNCRDLEIRVRDHSRSLKVVPFDRLHMVYY